MSVNKLKLRSCEKRMSIKCVTSVVKPLHIWVWKRSIDVNDTNSKIHSESFSPENFFCSDRSWRHIVWCLSCALKWTTVTTLYIFKVWGSAAFRRKRTDRWSGCSLSSLFCSGFTLVLIPPMITVHMLTTTEGLAFGCWLHGTDSAAAEL